MHVHYVSPRYTSEKLEPPFYRDMVDVFEDRVRGWLIDPAIYLLGVNRLSVPAIILCVNYFEAIEIYASGEDSKNRSKEFFKRGFQRVFSVRGQGDAVSDWIATALYESMRCGFAHDGMAKNGVNFSLVRNEPILVSYPRKNGLPDLSSKPAAFIVNPELFVKGVELHFNHYISDLKRSTDPVLSANFKRAAELKWALNQPGRVIGMTEKEFFSGGGVDS